MSSYAVYVCTSALKTATNRLFAMIEGEGVMTSENLSQPLSATGSAPYSHWYGGRPVSAAWLDVYQNLATNLPAPAGGWPLMNGQDVVLTELDAQAAAAALYLNVNTGENAETLPAQNIATVLSALGLKKPAPVDP